MKLSTLKQTISVCVIFSFTACGSGQYEYTELSKYTIKQDALAHGTAVDAYYCSGGPDYNEKGDYYYQYLVIDKKTNDTVKVLCPDLYEKQHIGNFISINSEHAALVLKQKNLSLPLKISKVISNKQYQHIENGNYPVVIGYLGIITQNDSIAQ